MSHINETLKKLLASESLSFEEAKKSMEEIMTGQVSDIKLSSWLTALRIKGETAAEIAGCASSMREHATTVPCNDPNAIDVVGTGGDGTHTINISTTAALVAAGCGITVAKHGNKSVSSKSGSADVLDSLGINIDITAEQMADCLNNVGIAYLFAPKLHPAMKYAMPVRKELGIRTIFNILGPLTNPAKVDRALLGVYSQDLAKIIAEAALNMNVKKFLVVHGADGVDEISITGNTKVFEVANGKIEEYFINPEQFGINIATLADIKGGTPEENAEFTRQILGGKLSGPMRDVVILNAAAAIIVADQATGWSNAIQKATESIDSGAALAKLDKLVKATK